MQSAVEAFKKGKLVALPTETVYGLAAPIDQPELLKKIFKLKQRPFFDPLIVHVENVEQAKSLTSSWPDLADRLVNKFWPGPLTIVLPKNNQRVSDLITSGLTTVGIRCPKHNIAQEFIRSVGVPVAAPSANKFGKTSPTSIEHVKSEFNAEDVYFLDGGLCQVGIESTIVGIKDNQLTILRSGTISENQIREVLKDNEELRYHSSHEVVAPGQVKHHYMPNIPLVFFRVKPNTDLLAKIKLKLNLAPQAQAGDLSLSESPELAARMLYSSMRELSENKNEFLYVFIDIDKNTDSNWKGVIDRLQKASVMEITSAAALS